jgi:hypothetical protein
VVTARPPGAAQGLLMPPSSYLRGGPQPAPWKPGQLCLGVRDTGATGFLIIGDTTMEVRTALLCSDRSSGRVQRRVTNVLIAGDAQNYYVAFDREQARGAVPLTSPRAGLRRESLWLIVAAVGRRWTGRG